MELVKEKQKLTDLEQINRSYAALCTEYGDKTYQIKRISLELQDIQARMQELDTQALAIHKKNREEAAAKAATAVPPLEMTEAASEETIA